MDSDDLMNRQDLMDRHEAAVLEPPVEMQQPVAEGDTVTTYAPQDLVPAQLLDGGETVLLAIKPSLWFIAFNSVRWILILSLVVVGVLWMSPGWQPVEPRLLIQAAIGVMVLRLAVASLQWVSRLYVLTNRRMMRFHGVLKAAIFQIPLTHIDTTTLSRQGDGPIHGASVQEHQTESGGHRTCDGALARARGPIDGDDHRPGYEIAKGLGRQRAYDS